jgi:integrase/recombinase XerD
MTPLRQRFLEDMQIRNLSVNTQRVYVEHVSRFARHFSQSPEALGPEEIRAYQVYLTNEKKLAPGSIVIAVSALRFLYKVTLKKDWSVTDIIPAPKKPQTLPVVLSPEEVVRFLDAVKKPKHRTILTTCYAAGLRISEAVQLTAAAIDSQRMVLRIEQGKGQKDRYVMLSPRLLEICATGGAPADRSTGCFPAIVPTTPSPGVRWSGNVRRPVAAVAFPNPSLPIHFDTHLLSTSWKRGPTSARFNCCSATGVSPPPPGICASRPARSVRRRAPWTYCHIPSRRSQHPRPLSISDGGRQWPARSWRWRTCSAATATAIVSTPPRCRPRSGAS